MKILESPSSECKGTPQASSKFNKKRISVQEAVNHLHIVLLNHNRQTGNTTIARNLAAAGALWGKPSLLVSCEEPQTGSVEILLGNARSILMEDTEISSLFYLYLKQKNLGLYMDFPAVQKELSSSLLFLPEIRQVIWDAPSTIASVTRAMLRFANIVFIPFNIENESFERLGESLGLLERTGKKESPNLLYWGLIPMFIRPEQRFSKLFSGLALPLFKTRMIPVPIPEDPVFRQAEKNRRPVFSEDMLSTGACAFRMLSRWIDTSFSAKNEQRRFS